MTDREAINGLKNIVEYWTLNSHEQEVAKHAISALQEREERSRGCAYCYTDAKLNPFVRGYNFCPMCGRPLKED